MKKSVTSTFHSDLVILYTVFTELHGRTLFVPDVYICFILHITSEVGL